MFFVDKDNQREKESVKIRKRLTKVGRILMTLAISGYLCGEGKIGFAEENVFASFTMTDSVSTTGITEVSTVYGTPLSTVTPTTVNNNTTSGKSYAFTNPSSGNVATFNDNNSYTSNNTPLINSLNNSNSVIITNSRDNTSNNRLTINGGTYDAINVYSINGYNLDNNTVIFNGGTASYVDIYSIDNGEIGYGFGNILTINGGTVGSAEAGTLTINGGTVVNAHGGNTLTINSGIVDFASTGNWKDGTFDHTGTVTINGGTVGLTNSSTANIYGGTIAGYSNGNPAVVAISPANSSLPGEINIYNSPDLSNATLAGFSSTTGSNITANLNIHTKNLTAQNIVGFNNINFYLPPTTVNGDTILTLTNGSTNLSGTSIRAGVEGNANLSTGDTVTLLKNANGIYTDETTTYGTLSEGVSLDYDLTVEKADDTSIIARVGAASGGSTDLKDQTDILPTTPEANATLVIDGTDRLLDWLPPDDPVTSENTSEQKKDAEKTSKADSPNDFQIFANMGFSNLRTKTGSNSYTDSHNGGFDIGAARTLENRHGKLVFAPVVDYGSGSYDSYSNSGMHGKGNTKYWAVGMIARQMNYNGFYYEASLRGGRAMMDFASDDFVQGAMPATVTYDTSAPCFAGHIRIGRLMQFGPQNQLHLYGIYSHNHQNGMSAQLSTGETYGFSSVDSGRLRIGGRLTWQKSRTQKFYSGIAYQYDFSSGTTGSYRGYSTSSSSIHGSSAMIELGWQVKPTERSPWMVDIGATGWVGHRKGFTVQAKLMKSF